MLEQDGIIQVESVQGGLRKNILLSELCTILQPRAEELFDLINESLEKHNLKSFIPAGLVLTGGGSLLEGMPMLASEVFGIPVRIGKPKTENQLLESLDNPKYATGYGLLLHVLQQWDCSTMMHLTGPLLQRITARMKSWVSDLF